LWRRAKKNAQTVEIIVLGHEDEILRAGTIPDCPIAGTTKPERNNVCGVRVKVAEIVGESLGQVLVE
jgi:hypothetical protein